MGGGGGGGGGEGLAVELFSFEYLCFLLLFMNSLIRCSSDHITCTPLSFILDLVSKTPILFPREDIPPRVSP